MLICRGALSRLSSFAYFSHPFPLTHSTRAPRVEKSFNWLYHGLLNLSLMSSGILRPLVRRPSLLFTFFGKILRQYCCYNRSRGLASETMARGNEHSFVCLANEIGIIFRFISLRVNKEFSFKFKSQQKSLQL
jgi:hypothetical protein